MNHQPTEFPTSRPTTKIGIATDRWAITGDRNISAYPEILAAALDDAIQQIFSTAAEGNLPITSLKIKWHEDAPSAGRFRIHAEAAGTNLRRIPTHTPTNF